MHPENKSRVERINPAVRLYETGSGLEFESAADVLFHILTDLRHWADASGVDFQEAIAGSAYQYDDEIHEHDAVEG